MIFVLNLTGYMYVFYKQSQSYLVVFAEDQITIGYEVPTDCYCVLYMISWPDCNCI